MQRWQSATRIDDAPGTGGVYQNAVPVMVGSPHAAQHSITCSHASESGFAGMHPGLNGPKYRYGLLAALRIRDDDACLAEPGLQNVVVRAVDGAAVLPLVETKGARNAGEAGAATFHF